MKDHTIEPIHAIRPQTNNLHHMNSPKTFRKLQAIEVGNDFHKVTRVVKVDYNDFIKNIKPNSVVVKNFHVGVNASDVNFTNGKYIPGIKP